MQIKNPPGLRRVLFKTVVILTADQNKPAPVLTGFRLGQVLGFRSAM
jgi:hypothetical protein